MDRYVDWDVPDACFDLADGASITSRENETWDNSAFVDNSQATSMPRIALGRATVEERPPKISG